MTEYKIIIDEFCENSLGNQNDANWDNKKYIGPTIDFFSVEYKNSKVKYLVDEFSDIRFAIAGSKLLCRYLKIKEPQIDVSVENAEYDINVILSKYKKVYNGTKGKISFCGNERGKLNEVIKLIRTKYPLAQDFFDFNTIDYDEYCKSPNSDNILLFIPESVWNTLSIKPQFTFYYDNVQEKISEIDGSHYWQGNDIKDVICSYFESLCLTQIAQKYHKQKKKVYENLDDLISWLNVNPNQHTIFCFERDFLINGEQNIITYYSKNSINKDNVLISSTELPKDKLDDFFNTEFIIDKGECILNISERNDCKKVRIAFVNIDNLFIIERTKNGYKINDINSTFIDRRIWGNGNITNFDFVKGENTAKDEKGRVKYGINDKIKLLIKGQCQEHHKDYSTERIKVYFNNSTYGPFDLNVSEENNEFNVTIPLTCPNEGGYYTVIAEGTRSHKKNFLELYVKGPAIPPDNFNIVFDFEKNNKKKDKVIDKQVYTFKNIHGDIIEAKEYKKVEHNVHIVSYSLNNMKNVENIPEDTIIVEFPNNIKTLAARIEYTIQGRRCINTKNNKGESFDEYINLDANQVRNIDLHTRNIKQNGLDYYKIKFKKQRDPRVIPLIALVVLSIISCFTHCFVWFGMTLPLLFVYFAPLIIAEFTVFPKIKREELKEKSQYLIVSFICIIVSILIITHAVYEECFK